MGERVSSEYPTPRKKTVDKVMPSRSFSLDEIQIVGYPGETLSRSLVPLFLVSLTARSLNLRDRCPLKAWGG